MAESSTGYDDLYFIRIDGDAAAVGPVMIMEGAIDSSRCRVAIRLHQCILYMHTLHQMAQELGNAVDGRPAMSLDLNAAAVDTASRTPTTRLTANESLALIAMAVKGV